MLYYPRHDLDVVGKILYAAADYLEGRVWCRDPFNAPQPENGDTCIMLAILYAPCPGSLMFERGDAGQRLREFLQWEPADWNDEVCENQEQAVAALRGAARHK